LSSYGKIIEEKASLGHGVGKLLGVLTRGEKGMENEGIEFDIGDLW